MQNPIVRQHRHIGGTVVSWVCKPMEHTRRCICFKRSRVFLQRRGEAKFVDLALIPGHLPSGFSVRRVGQGDALSCLVFQIALEKVIRYFGIKNQRSPFLRMSYFQVLAFANDIVIVERTTKYQEKVFEAIELR